MRELRDLGKGLNTVQVSIARLESGQTAMSSRMDGHERQMERIQTAVQDFDRFRSGAGVKLGAGVWVGTVVGAALIVALVSALVWALKAQGAPTGQAGRPGAEGRAAP